MDLRREQDIRTHRLGFTLIELTVVILVLLGLIAISFSSLGSLSEWQRAREVSSVLREVEVAQRQFLADNPQQDLATLTDPQIAVLAGYLPGNPTTLPTTVGNDQIALTVNVRVSPPVALNGGAVYDPSGNPNDGLWDTGR